MSGVVATLAMAGLQSPAFAYGRMDISGGLGHATTNNVNDVLFGCDDKANGIGVYGRFIMQEGSLVDVPDPDGESGGCGVDDWRGTGYYAYKLQAVQRDGTASAWGYTY
ncbi:hypothetical protein HDA40_005524 [Hamadaea flava]|uniref:Uncharacterized protein n=1 Tax=Hamadaea flava TaxID=1742688 RepID=A0ABV8LZH0_9ACTN|nr:hypothetical protein [Hamadaea flava]